LLVLKGSISGIRERVMGFMLGRMVVNMKASGKTHYSTALENRTTLQVRGTQASGNGERKMAMGGIRGPMDRRSRVSMRRG